MDNKRIGANKAITWDTHGDFEYLDYLRVIQFCAYKNGYDITLKDASELWDDISYENFCSFMGYNLEKINELWDLIKHRFSGAVETADGIKQIERRNEFNIDFIIDRKQDYLQSGLGETRRVLSYRIGDAAKNLTVDVAVGLRKIIKSKGIRICYHDVFEIWAKFQNDEFTENCRLINIDAVWEIIKDSEVLN